MDNLQTSVVKENEITQKQQSDIKTLAAECFPDVTATQDEEHFYAESFARILAYDNDLLVGHLKLFNRKVEYANQPVNLGGMGAVCVTSPYRGKGIATNMLKRGLDVLKERNCDIVCLNVDTSKETYKLYESVGFKMLQKNISFEDSHGEIKFDDGTMFLPLHSHTVCDAIMKGEHTFHYGKGYW